MENLPDESEVALQGRQLAEETEVFLASSSALALGVAIRREEQFQKTLENFVQNISRFGKRVGGMLLGAMDLYAKTDAHYIEAKQLERK